MSPTSPKSPTPPKPLAPGVERRRQLRDQRRRERLNNLWRLALFSACAAGLGYGLLRHGWSLRGPEQVNVIGSQQVSRDQVVEAAGLQFPILLLNLQPKQLQQRLAAALPVENVEVERLMLPPRLRIDLVDRQAVARAQRGKGAGLERGYVDRLGNWMSLSHQQVALTRTSPQPMVSVLGWQEWHRPALAQILERRNSLGSPLQEIRFEPNGHLLLRTKALGQVRLGPADAQLLRRLELMHHLTGELPGQLKGRTIQSIDLSDPDKPELGLPAAPAKEAAKGSTGTVTAGTN
ncbi:FtsQ-type POTRA domain-containing protein [Synechococcus sp. CS-603]|nr:FtsQ-type POTRA domain-containing protein [Synechococcus sp. CS-603]